MCEANVGNGRAQGTSLRCLDHSYINLKLFPNRKALPPPLFCPSISISTGGNGDLGWASPAGPQERLLCWSKPCGSQATAQVLSAPATVSSSAYLEPGASHPGASALVWNDFSAMFPSPLWLKDGQGSRLTWFKVASLLQLALSLSPTVLVSSIALWTDIPCQGQIMSLSPFLSLINSCPRNVGSTRVASPSLSLYRALSA